ncbi:hypothetical protein KIN20_023400 [Parelaphostrongylus tenuis]|uniref:7TM GPCR serpentine receptor class x (Srx) domain-containing protein n=1 Tax=Parelaphostrongylus tenuis TaxID=148309 RepID=A0AAD5MRP3_PARTN|nr:hypothetical protein KIN20_023400 [Parelaphostrongylus tenuis]
MNSHNSAGIRTNAIQRRRQNMEVRLFKQVKRLGNHGSAQKMPCQNFERIHSFFFQTLCQNALFVCQLISSYWISLYFENQWAKFFTDTFIWELSHALDGERHCYIAVFHVCSSQCHRLTYLKAVAMFYEPKIDADNN